MDLKHTNKDGPSQTFMEFKNPRLLRKNLVEIKCQYMRSLQDNFLHESQRSSHPLEEDLYIQC